MMKKRRIAQAIVACALFSLASPLYAATPWLHTEGNLIKDPCGNTVVLRGLDTIDIGTVERSRGSTSGGVNILIDRITNKSDSSGTSPGWYPRVIRLAVYPIDAGLSGPLFWETDPNYYYNNLLRPVVDHCKQKDLYVIIDWHYVGVNTYDKVPQTNAFWSYIAPRFAGDSHVMFELFQEPLNTSGGYAELNWATCKPDMQNWTNIIRATAPNNLILVGSPSWSQQPGPAAANPLTGDNIVMVTHIYPGHWLLGNRALYTSQVDTCLTRYPVFSTEWGFRSGAGDNNLQGTITNYGQPFLDWREARKISSSGWVTDYSWEPTMFNTDWTLRIGEGEMGGFTKDMLYAYKDADQPSDGNTIPPDAPTGLTATPSTGTVTLTWNSNTDGDLYGYDIYRSTTSGGQTNRQNLVRSKTTSYTDISVAGTRTYYYVVTAVDTNFNSSADSIEVSATVPADSTPPAAPSGLTATTGNVSVLLGWNNNIEPDINGYNVYRSTTYGGPYTRLNGTPLTISDYNDISVTNGTTYFYVVTATDTSLNESANSRQVSAMPHIDLPVEIVGSWVSGTTHAKEAGINRALVFVAHAKGAGSTADITAASYGGRPMTKIIYRRQGSSTTRVYVAAFILNEADINAADSGGNFSVTWSATPPSVTYTSVFLKNVNQSPLFDANASNGVTGSTSVSTSALATSNGDMVIESAASSVAGTYNSSGWTKDIDLLVTGYDGMGGHKAASGASETPSITQATANHALIGFVVKFARDIAPAKPKGLTASPGVRSIAVYWNDNTESDLAGYNIYRSTVSGTLYVKLNSDLLSSSEYFDSAVADGTTYYYVVTATDTGGQESDRSGEISSTPRNPAKGTGSALLEWWNDIPGNNLNNLLNDVNFPDNPSGGQLITKLERPVNSNDNYGERIRGYLNPVTSGNYSFWISGADESELDLSTDANPAHIGWIASVPDYTDPCQWDKYPSQTISSIWLVAGQKYYFEVLHKADVGNNHVAVAWEGPGVIRQIVDGLYLSPIGLEFSEFAGFAEQWGRTDCAVGNDWCSGNDFNRDGTVDLNDLASFADGWLTEEYAL